jgi:hypothetical protein
MGSKIEIKEEELKELGKYRGVPAELRNIKEITFDLYLVNKELFISSRGQMYVRLEFTEELFKEEKPKINVDNEDIQFMQKITQAASQMMKQLIPQANMPIYPFIRLYVILNKEDYDKLKKKPDIGDKVTIVFSRKKIKIKSNG